MVWRVKRYAKDVDENDIAVSFLVLQDTISRDLKQVYLNLKLVVFPFGSDRDDQTQALRNWDLWGPMVTDRRIASTGSNVSPAVDGCLCVHTTLSDSPHQQIFVVAGLYFGAGSLSINWLLTAFSCFLGE